MAKYQLLLSFWCTLLTYTTGQGITPILRTVGKAQCVKNSVTQTLTTRFVTKLNGDDINYTYGKRLISVAAGFESKVCTNAIINSVDENSQPAKYLTVTSMLNLTTLTDAAATNPCGFLMTTDPVKGRGFIWRLALRKVENFQYDIDRDYQWTCYESEALPTFVTAVLSINDPSVVELAVQNPVVSLMALRKVGDVYTTSTVCNVGDDMKLRLQMVNPAPTYQSFIHPWGLYSFNTRVARTSADITAQQNYNELIGSGGCPVNPNLLELAGGFTRTADSTTLLAFYDTGVFQCKRYLNSNQLFFSTIFQFCFGAVGADTKCNDFCAYTTAQTSGRRRRQANVTEELDMDFKATLVVEVADGLGANRGADFNTGSSLSSRDITIIITTVVGAVVLLAIIVAAILVVMVSKRRNYKDGSETDSLPSSRASSDRKFPVL